MQICLQTQTQFFYVLRYIATFLLSSNKNTTEFQLHLQLLLHVPHCYKLALGSSIFETLSLLLTVRMRMPDGLVSQTSAISSA